jgi:hypothetical protein
MAEIWKFQLPVNDIAYVGMPAGSRVLSVAVQQDTVVVYAAVNPKEETRVQRRFRIAGTGHPVENKITKEDGWRFLGTVSLRDGALMFHVFVAE